MALISYGIYINSNLTSKETKEQYQFYPTAISNWLFFGFLFLFGWKIINIVNDFSISKVKYSLSHFYCLSL